MQSLLPDVSDGDCKCIVKECGHVPLAMRLMCSIVAEQHVSVKELLEELKISPLVEVLDNESFSDDVRLKMLINKTFQRLTNHDKKAFVSLAVFPGCFTIREARNVLNLKTFPQTRKKIGSLIRKSLIQCSGDFETFTIHPLLRSFIEEKRTTDQETGAVFRKAQRRLYISRIFEFGLAIKKFLTSRSNEALVAFLRLRESIIQIISSLIIRARGLYHIVIKVISKAKARKRLNVGDERKLRAAKTVGDWGWFLHRQAWVHFLQEGHTDAAGCPAKLLCYSGFYQLDEGHKVLVVSHMEKQGGKVVSHFFDVCCRTDAKTGSACVGGLPLSRPRDDYPFVTVDAILPHLVLTKRQTTGPVTSILEKHSLSSFLVEDSSPFRRHTSNKLERYGGLLQAN